MKIKTFNGNLMVSHEHNIDSIAKEIGMKVYSVSWRSEYWKSDDIVYQSLSIRNAMSMCQRLRGKCSSPHSEPRPVVLETDMDRTLYGRATVVSNITNTDDENMEVESNENMEVEGPVTIYSVFGSDPFINVDDAMPVFQTLDYQQVVSMAHKRRRVGSELLVVKSTLDTYLEDGLETQIQINGQNQTFVSSAAKKKCRI